MSAGSRAYDLPPILDPAASVFVSANAGAGKTSLLTDRVLRLLLSGAPPGKILCLTYTNAAAAEMKMRVQRVLGGWVMADEAALHAALRRLLGEAPDARMMRRARSLFATVLEAPEGVRVQTIHGFCQSLLRRFPIEAGVSPHFTVADERNAQALLQEARRRLFSRTHADIKLQAALEAMACTAGEASFNSLIDDIIKNKRRFVSLFSLSGNVEDIVRRIWKQCGLAHGVTVKSLIQQHFAYDEPTLMQLRLLPPLLLAGKGKSDGDTGRGLAAWLEVQSAAGEGSGWEAVSAYVNVFITQKGTRRKNLFTKKTLEDEGLIAVLLAEQERTWRFSGDCRSLTAAERATHLLHVADALLALYDALKRQRALLDYDDLILIACRLLKQRDISPWVLFKLDGGIDHVLVDEAQDTSPEQWEIIDRLTQEFFAGEGGRRDDRSLFVVGDEKQSIFSFQGADPAALGRWRCYFSQRIRDAARVVHEVPLTHSYRSAPEILAAVDAVFASPQARAGLTFEEGDLAHIPTRLEHAGLVELWPLLEEDGEVSPVARLVREVAKAISNWLKQGVMLESKGRPVQPGDVMILLRTRTTLADRLVRALKRLGVPVAGQDRMALGDNLAVQDLVALGQCLLLPEDDLTLAALLKSPLFEADEELLFRLAHGRGDATLWDRLRESKEKAAQDAFALLSGLRGIADYVPPYELFAYVLDTLGGRARFTGRMGAEYEDAIDEFLGQALLYERGNVPSLQGFLHWLADSDSEIKRDMEQAQNAVRVMTVHASKGLQAPIVILPDTTSLPSLKDRLLWQECDGVALPLWPGDEKQDDALTARARAAAKQAMFAEYRRLLYVALTRAEDRLYVCGASGRKKIGEEEVTEERESVPCWYEMVRDGMAGKATAVEMAGGQGWRMGEALIPSPAGGGSGWGHVGKDILQHAPLPASSLRGEEYFNFLTRPAPAEPMPPRPLAPSRPGEEPAAASPLLARQVYRRGNLIHKLLQHLPDIPAEQREKAARAMAADPAMPENIREACIRETLAVLNDEHLAFVFAEGSVAEVPVAGCVELNGQVMPVAGQIDRLHVGEKEVWIVDFKSNREPPANAADIPPAYLRQMRLYRLLLSRIYPDKPVHCALVWTAVPKITLLDEALLDEIPLSAYI